jgi:hypothetical protein
MLLAHPLMLRAMIQRRCKTDRLDAQLLANLLRINQIPLAYNRGRQERPLRVRQVPGQHFRQAPKIQELVEGLLKFRYGV